MKGINGTEKAMGSTVEHSCFILAGWLIDGSGRKAVKDCLIEIRGEKIFSASPAAPGIKLPPAYEDFSGCTVIPGLTDSHTHLTISGCLDPQLRDTQLTDGYESAGPRIRKHINDYLAHGVVAVRDGGDFHAHVLKYKNEFQAGREKNLAIYAAGNGLHKKDRYGQLLGMYLEPGRDPGNAVLEDFRPGTDHVKVVNSGVNSLKAFGRETKPQFTRKELKSIVDAAGSIGLDVMVHANGKIPVRLAVEAGCRTIEHGFFMGDDNLKRMADAGAAWCPTACTMKAYRDITSPYDPQYHVAEKNMLHQLEQIEKAVKYGVTIIMGTDAACPGVYHGGAVIDEFKLLMEAGMSVEQAVKSAASDAAKIIRNPSGNGTIAKGMPATFAVLNGTPSGFPDSLKNIKCLWIKGRKV